MSKVLLRGAAGAIWESVDGRGSVPTAAVKAASDLFELYERLNRAPLAELVGRFPGGVTGDDLAWFAMTPGVPATNAIYVPTFTVSYEDGELIWEGGERHVRNPASSVPVVLLIEDEPKLQASTAKMIGKVLPDSHVVIADNADAAIADLQHHGNVVLVVSDYDILGDKTGLDVFRWVQQHQPHLVNRYLFFSGNNAVEDQGAAVLLKPAGIADFKAAVLALGAPKRATPRRQATVAPPIERPRSVAMPAPELTTQEVADAVLAVMPSIGAEGHHGEAKGRFGDRKVFIAAIWRRLGANPRFQRMTLEQFKRHLLDANRQGLLVLSRADLRGAMDAAEVLDSEIDDRGSTFNFVNDPTVGKW